MKESGHASYGIKPGICDLRGLHEPRKGGGQEKKIWNTGYTWAAT